jgi:hypothetical protein
MPTDPLRLHIDLQPASEPIEGHLAGEHGETVSFTGWLELIAAIQHAMAGASDRTSHEGEPPA